MTDVLQRAVLEIFLLSLLSGAVGTWIVFKRASFFAHAIGAGAFPGFLWAVKTGIAPQLGGAISASLVAGGIRVTVGGAGRHETATGIWVVAAVAGRCGCRRRRDSCSNESKYWT